MKIVAICGSYRKGKTIDTLMDKAIEGIKEADPSIEVEKIYLIDKDIKYCTNCMTCRNDDPGKPLARCVLQDDMQQIYKDMDQAAGYIFGTPVNCGSVTAIVKTFIDRSIWVFGKPGTKPFKGCPTPRTNKKRAALVVISAGIVPTALGWLCNDARRLLSDLCTCGLNAKVVGNMYAGAIDKKGAAAYFDQARKNGEKLARALMDR